MKLALDLRSAVAAASLAFASMAAHSITLDFEELPHADELQGVGDVVSSKGLVLSYAPAPGEPYPVGFQSVGATWRFNERSTALMANSCSAVTTMVAKNGRLMKLVSIDLDEANGDDHAEVTFEGTTADDSIVTHSVRLNGKSKWQTVRFPESFRQLKSLAWKQGDCINNPPHMFDNLQLRLIAR